jgi:hypothetical protein
MITKLIDTLFGCRHSHYSFPITVRRGMRRNSAALLTGTYVACLDCGKEFAYDWNEMKVMTSSAEGRERMRALTHKAAA